MIRLVDIRLASRRLANVSVERQGKADDLGGEAFALVQRHRLDVECRDTKVERLGAVFLRPIAGCRKQGLAAAASECIRLDNDLINPRIPDR